MKKNLIFVLLMVSAMGLSAQMYVGLGFGYHTPAQNRALGEAINSAGDKSNIYGSMGQGVIPALKFGYTIDDNWGFELGFSYLIGSKITIRDNVYPGSYESYNDVATATSTMLRFSPQLVFKTEMGLYSRVGLIIPLSGKTIGSSVVAAKLAGQTTTINIEYESHGAITIGFTGAVGYGYSLNDEMTVFGEMEYIGLRIYGKTFSITRYDINGVNDMPNMTANQIETVYVDEIKHTDNKNTNEARKELKSSTPFSSFGINFGIAYHFN